MNSLQAESALPDMVSYYHPGLGISLMVPASWNGQLFEDPRLRLLGPPEPEFDLYRPTMDIQAGAPEGGDDVWLAHFFAQAGAQMRRSYPEFVLMREETFRLSTQQVVQMRLYRWIDAQSQRHFTALQALILRDGNTLYLINGATLTPLATRDMPIFETAVRSMRIIDLHPEG